MRMPARHSTLPALALASLLVAAHFAAAWHTLEHDIDLLQGKACAICVTAAQLGSASVADHPAPDLEHPGGIFITAVTVDFISIRTVAVRQRGPPAPL
jgi:hypothetical protein